MNRRIQLLWDFYGGDAEKTAAHHVKHLKEFMLRENIPYSQTGVKSNGELHGMAFLTVNEEDVLVLRDALRPNRALVFKD
jgi:hypothetical protein